MFFTRNSREKIGGGVKRKPLALAPLAALALGALLAACPQPAGDTGAAPPDTGAEAPFTAVTGITGVPTGGVKGFALDLSKAAAAPANATNKTIVWTLKAEGRTAMARGVEGAKYTPEQAGRATLTASVKDGAAPGRDYTKDFELAITEQHIPVTDITGVPENGRAGTALDLSGVRVVPEDATNKTIVWSVAPASAVNADIDGAFITPGSGGALTLWAEISQGKSGGEPYARAFSVAVSPRPPAAPGAPVLAAGDRQISVTWAGVETAAAYEVWYGTASDSASAAQSGGDVSGTAAEITGLTNGKVYHVWIKAKNAGGASGFSPSAWAAPLEAGCVPIGSAEDLAKIGTEGFPMGGAYILLGDIELNGWDPIGAVSDPFTGTFDGNGRTVTITGFSAEAMSRNVFLGIFAYVKGESAAAKAVIKDLTINSQIDSIGTNAGFALAVGLLAGYAENTEISNITLQGSFTFKTRKSVVLGGVAGYLQDGAILRNATSSMSMLIDGGGGDSILGFPYYNYVGGFAGAFDSRDGTGAIIENCHNTGPVSAHCTTTDSQVFLGGIAGGSYYAFSTTYKGYIQDCSSSGDITGYAKHFWTFAGGIAGAMTGGTSEDGNMENDTRIVRCRASGTINALDSNSPFPYVGGIVGYNYFGAVVSQCVFSGTVLGWDYTGGIAGYNSKEFDGHGSRIEDCRSEGQVIGAHIAGGIVGQNQVCATVKRCYSTAVISTTEGGTGAGGSSGQGGISGAGGVAGFNAGSGGDQFYPTVSGCFALNGSISYDGTDGRFHRITGYTEHWDETRPHNNYARSGLTPSGLGYVEDKGAHRPDGADCEERPPQALYQGAGWDFSSVWKMGGDGLPRLKWE